MKILILSFLLTLAAFAQTVKPSVVVTWADNVNPAGTTYSVVRIIGNTCPGSTDGGVQIAKNLTSKTYTDANLAPGAYCYAVIPQFNGVYGPLSDGAQVVIPLMKVTGVSATVTVQITTQ